MTSWREIWRQVDREDPHDSGWWQLARISRSLDGNPDVWQLETNTRGSVVSTELRLTTDDVRRLLDALTEEIAR